MPTPLKAPTKKKIEEVASHLAWNFLQVLDDKIIEELQHQIEELTTGEDEAAEFVKSDPEGHILYTILGDGLDRLADKTPQEEWKSIEVFAVAWMIRDLVVEQPNQVTE
tara:strand:- start:21 stop:347 length:327 start_codon:yes stop_codon:yes gene_type:complete